MATKKHSHAGASTFLRHIRVRDFSLLRSLDMEVLPGLSVLTGSSGAGKTLIFDAISFVFGARTTRSVLAAGASDCEVKLVLNLSAEDASQLGPPWQQGENEMSRRFFKSGKSGIELNGATLRLQDAQAAGSKLVEVTGQFESQSLFNREAHLGLVDKFASATQGELLIQYEVSYMHWLQATRALEALRINAGTREQELEFLNFQCAELERAGVKPGEKSEIERQLSLQRHAQQLCDAADRASSALEGDGDTPSAYDRAAEALTHLDLIERVLGGEESTEAVALVKQALAELQEAAGWSKRLANSIDYDAALESELSDRLDAIIRLERKYACAADDLQALMEDKAGRIQALNTALYDPHAAEVKAEEAEAAARAIAQDLSLQRHQAAAVLQRSVTEQLAKLDFPTVGVELDFQESTQLGLRGFDIVEILITLNPGEPARPLAQVASGGEASRLLLAFKCALSDKLPFRLVLLDEIEAGLGGETASRVAAALARLAEHRQVLAITHLPVVAARAATHYCVSKGTSGQYSSTSISKLDAEGRERELGRMTGGKGKEALALARQLLNYPKASNGTAKDTAPS